MLELHFRTPPNRYKILICLEELGLPYRPKGVDSSRGEQFRFGQRARG
ncbi:MAG TPA: hypothetical protein VLK85_21775 [Ramlibacter sp.]|nr:hypothetical protein [Ramlibacter sp.]